LILAQLDKGIKALIIIANHFELNCDYNQIKHNYAFDNEGISKINLVRAAKEIGLKSKLVKSKISKLNKLKTPYIVFLEKTGYVIITNIIDGKIRYIDIETMKDTYLDLNDFEKHWDEELILFTYRERMNKESNFGMKWFIDIIFKYKIPLKEVLFSSLVMQLLGLVSPAIMQIIIDKVLVHSTKNTLWIIAFCLLCTMLFEWVLSIGRMIIFSHMTSRIDVTLNSKLFNHLHSLPIKYFENRKVGEITNRIRETEKIRSFLTGTPITTVIDLVFIVIYLIIMFWYSIKLSTVTLLVLPAFILLSLIVTPIFKRRVKERFDKNSELMGYLVEAISGMNTLKGLAVEKSFEKKWESKMANYVSSSYKTKDLGNITNSFAELIQKLLNLLVLWLGTKEVLKGNLTIGAFIAFRMYSSNIIMPIIRTLQLWQTFQQTGVAVENLKDIFNNKPEISYDKAKTVLPNLMGALEFDKVTFKYDLEGQEILKDVSFRIREGSSLGIIGRSGSGKSTVSKLIQKLYGINRGKILIDGVDTSLVDPSWIRRQIGVVLQENYLFNDSVKNNIDIAKQNYSQERIEWAAKLAGAHEFIMELPEGYNTVIGEKGSMLSGGQKQRVAIARALVGNPRILIFDEATSALDYESESIIQKNMKEIIKGRTMIMIAHRMSTLRDVDFILSLDKGQVVEFGKKENLIKSRGLYSYMCSQQMG
jgi:subfamily B ATP-binding cassette protein HlyB/CyaB